MHVASHNCIEVHWVGWEYTHTVHCRTFHWVHEGSQSVLWRYHCIALYYMVAHCTGCMWRLSPTHAISSSQPSSAAHCPSQIRDDDHHLRSSRTLIKIMTLIKFSKSYLALRSANCPSQILDHLYHDDHHNHNDPVGIYDEACKVMLRNCL